ncbi:hypothetical protein SteCoe_21347 [Stentor coeruleus]|uniref:RING-type domain-containing protein n=1 Tax=Stentor coeruleus TaxID=5963 RepID=A0A1R2BPN5_9CILI|nr:hypothetical protein SteCoe_21347 [Stentor coeruleus]
MFETNTQPCKKCFMPCDTNCKNCGFYVCQNCMSDECLICQSLCDYCIISNDTVKLSLCMHTICQDCIKNSSCPLCNAIKEDSETDCEYCCEKKTTTKRCAHYICEDCFTNNQSLCPLCRISKKINNEKDSENKSLEEIQRQNCNNWQILACDEGSDLEKTIVEIENWNRTVYLKENNIDDANFREAPKSTPKIKKVTKKNEYFPFEEDEVENVLNTGEIYNSPHNVNPENFDQSFNFDTQKNLCGDNVEIEDRQAEVSNDENKNNFITFGEDFDCKYSKSSVRNNFQIVLEAFEIDEKLESKTINFRKIFSCCKRKENLLGGSNERWYTSFCKIIRFYNCNLRQVGQKYFCRFINCCDLCKRFKQID